jgi:hypothetical protein
VMTARTSRTCTSPCWWCWRAGRRMSRRQRPPGRRGGRRVWARRTGRDGGGAQWEPLTLWRRWQPMYATAGV